MDMDNDRSKPEEDESSALKADLARARLGRVVHYVMLGFAPVVSVVALIFAVMAYTGNQANREHLGAINSRIDGIGANQTEPRGELDIFKVSLAHEKALLAEERKKQTERDAAIIRNVTQLQNKLKVTPTLEEQLRESAPQSAVALPVAGTAVAASAVSNTAPVPVAVPVQSKAAPPTIEKKPPVQLPKPAESGKKTVPVAKEAVKKPAPKKPVPKKPAATPTSAEKAAKAKALKKTIEDFNKSDKK